MSGRGAALVLTAVTGALLALQAPINARVRSVVGGVLPAATVSFLIGTALLVAVTALVSGLGRVGDARHVAWYYLAGGALGAIYVAVALATVTRLGAGGVTAATIAGQLAAAVALDHFGVLGLERQPVSLTRIAGVALLAAGTLLVVRE